MNGHSGHLLVAAAVIVAFTLVFNDLLAALAATSEVSNTRYIIHLMVFASIIAYTLYLRYDCLIASHKLAIFRQTWCQIPGGIAVYKKNKLIETAGDASVFRDYGLLGGRQSGAEEEDTPERLTRTEECQGASGERRHADRYIFPLVSLNGGDYSAELLLDATQRMTELRHREEEYVRMLRILVNMFEIKDPYSHGHSEIVSNLAQELAAVMSLAESEVNAIGRAALLHDIGKIIIPTEILNKPEKLSAAEREIIQEHACVGADVLGGMKLFQKETVLVRHHHERFDGQGYPAGLNGTEIPLGSRIIAIADAFDAITAGRSAEGRRDVAATLAILEQEKGRQFDPEVVDCFVAMVRTQRTGKI